LWSTCIGTSESGNKTKIRNALIVDDFANIKCPWPLIWLLSEEEENRKRDWCKFEKDADRSTENDDTIEGRMEYDTTK
jgi:hypothetical protein